MPDEPAHLTRRLALRGALVTAVMGPVAMFAFTAINTTDWRTAGLMVVYPPAAVFTFCMLLPFVVGSMAVIGAVAGAWVVQSRNSARKSSLILAVLGAISPFVLVYVLTLATFEPQHEAPTVDVALAEQVATPAQRFAFIEGAVLAGAQGWFLGRHLAGKRDEALGDHERAMRKAAQSR